MAKTLTIEQVKEAIAELQTDAQIEIKDYIQVILDRKKEAAKKEFELINGTSKQ
jgi:hypothetical protein